MEFGEISVGFIMPEMLFRLWYSCERC